MPLLALLIKNTFGALFIWLGLYFTKRAANTIVFISATAAAAAAMYGTIYALISGISAATPTELSTALSWIWPDNGNACIAAVFGAHVASAAFKWYKSVVMATATTT